MADSARANARGESPRTSPGKPKRLPGQSGRTNSRPGTVPASSSSCGRLPKSKPALKMNFWTGCRISWGNQSADQSGMQMGAHLVDIQHNIVFGIDVESRRESRVPFDFVVSI